MGRGLRGRADAALPVYYGWAVAAACFVSAGVVFGATYSFGVFFEALVSEFAASRARLSLVFGLQTFVMYVGAAGLGAAVDRFGVRLSLLAGAALLGAGLVGTSRATDLVGLFASYGVVAALGMSLIYVVAYATVPRWFGRRRGLANGLATAGLGVGVFVVPPAATALIDALGWRAAYLAFAGAFVALLLAAVLVLADDPVAVGAEHADEFPDGYEEDDGNGGLDRAATVARSPAFVLVLAGWTLVYATLYVVMTHVVLYAGDAGLGRSVGALAISVIGATTGVSRLGVGYVSDRLGRVHIFVVCSAVMALATGAMGVSGPVVLLALGVVFGVGYGGNGALLSPLVADLFGRDGLSTTYGLLSVAFAVSGLLAPYLAARGVAALDGYATVFAIAGVCGLVGAACVAAAGRFAPAD